MQWGFLNETKQTFNHVYLSLFVFDLRGLRASDTNDPIFQIMYINSSAYKIIKRLNNFHN
jgi:hypothetical protein